VLALEEIGRWHEGARTTGHGFQRQRGVVACLFLFPQGWNRNYIHLSMILRKGMDSSWSKNWNA